MLSPEIQRVFFNVDARLCGLILHIWVLESLKTHFQGLLWAKSCKKKKAEPVSASSSHLEFVQDVFFVPLDLGLS